ncbi:VanZ family protein [Pelobacter seleniigenes]|uniref:VanZ family protein n=1 Tax=Pelobacter seleniigenes TaxID=407188 RepID=UPI0004A74151|nr:VanZ family protein [Pelobacter seleniigenes]
MTLLTFIKGRWKILTLFLLTTIIMLSLWPQDQLPPVPGSDKVHHLLAYTALMFPVALRKPRYWQLIGVLFILLSGIIELIQPYVHRYCDWRDWAANVTGVLCALLLAALFNRNTKGVAS